MADNIWDEIRAAGLSGLPFSLSADGTLHDGGLTEAQRAQVDAVLSAFSFAKASLFAYAAAVRFSKETGGIAVAGTTVATDRQSQAMIAGAFNYVQQNPSAVIKW